MKLSIVTSMYMSAPDVREFYERASAAARKITDDYEIILVNDGSPDETLGIAISIHEADARVKVVDLSRNFGHHRALMIGIGHAKGDLVFVLDSDLEEEPELLARLYEEYQKGGADVVYGVQDRRKGGAWERTSGAIFYWLFNLLSSQRIPKNPLNARLMSRRYVDSLLEHREREVFIDGLWAITGYRQVPVTVHKHSKGSTTYTMGRKLAMTMKSITGFSNKPLICISLLGVAILLLAFLYFVYTIFVMIFVDEAPVGFPSIILSIWFLGGLIIFCVGVVAIYLSIIFNETKGRPYSIVRKLYERGEG